MTSTWTGGNGTWVLHVGLHVPLLAIVLPVRVQSLLNTIRILLIRLLRISIRIHVRVGELRLLSHVGLRDVRAAWNTVG
jgi:hypothetical protein